jgi:photoactive yellow protein
MRSTAMRERSSFVDTECFACPQTGGSLLFRRVENPALALFFSFGGVLMTPLFEAPDLVAQLDAMALPEFDSLPFGLITMNRFATVLSYNSYESTRAGIRSEVVLGENFFESIGLCTNNYLIAQRYLDEPDLDDVLDYVFTLRMAPTPVRLRMMARAGSARQYLAVVNR